ncbi:coiled-coil domain-containing protein 102A-like [Ptychodera flava]|uniref:coiled-coil domain-containing protein 102A-like n=1 Tax=Ptychodera flava TaxID=63121 RepID=UPI00396A879B
MSMKHGNIPKMGDVSNVGATSKSYKSQNPTPEKALSEVLPLPPSCMDNNFEAKEELRIRELEEARARAAQMEKTMRWWSDCTANWREKWGKVRAERNKAREECRQVRAKLENQIKESAALKREKEELIRENEKLCKEIHKIQQQLEKEQASSVSSESSSSKVHIPERDIDTGIDQETEGAACDNLFLNDIMDNTNTGRRKKSWKHDDDKRQLPSPEAELAGQKIQMFEMKLEESTKTIQAERDAKEVLHREMEKLQAELTSMKNRYEELKKSKQETLKELSLLKSEHEVALGRITSDLEDEASTRSNMDRRLADMRKELERLQAENAAEWGKRERLETEKLALERESKKLRTQVEDLEENLLKKNRQASAAMDSDLKTLQTELYEKNKELAELKHTHTKLKKIFQDKSAELGHAQRRAEQHEGEVKKLRARIEELKKELARAEDEVDTQTNNVRRIQRSLDETQEQNDSLTVQLEHLQNRLRRQANTGTLFKKRNSSLISFNSSESVEGESDEDFDDCI